MGGFYLEDFAVWVRTQKGSILRGVICLALLIFAGVTVWKGYSVKDELVADIAALDDALAQDKFDINTLDYQMQELNVSGGSMELFTPSTDGGDTIARLQSMYSGYGSNSAEDTEKQLSYVRNGNPEGTDAYLQRGLKGYTTTESLRNMWFDNYRVSYEWRCLSRQSLVLGNASSVDVVFKCYFEGIYPIAVVVGKFDTATGLLNYAEVYTSYQGTSVLQIIPNNNMSSNVPTFPGDLLNYDRYNRFDLNWKTGNIVTETPAPTDAGTEENPGTTDSPGETDNPGTNPGSDDGGTTVPPDGTGGDEDGSGEGSEGSNGFDLNKILEGLGS